MNHLKNYLYLNYYLFETNINKHSNSNIKFQINLK